MTEDSDQDYVGQQRTIDDGDGDGDSGGGGACSGGVHRTREYVFVTCLLHHTAPGDRRLTRPFFSFFLFCNWAILYHDPHGRSCPIRTGGNTRHGPPDGAHAARGAAARDDAVRVRRVAGRDGRVRACVRCVRRRGWRRGTRGAVRELQGGRGAFGASTLDSVYERLAEGC